MYYVNIFFFFSLIGFVYENLLKIFTKAGFESGLMYGPWVPVYGFGVVVAVLVDQFLKKKSLRKWIEIGLFFLITTIIVTLLELAAGYFIEWVFGEVFWSYDWSKLRIGKYICLEVSLIWGVLLTLINYLVIPKIKKFLKKIPCKLTIALSIAFIFDFIVTLFKA